MKTLTRFLGFLLFISFAISCETDNALIDEAGTDLEISDELDESKAGPWTRVFTDNFNANGNLNQWQKANRYDYNSSLCRYNAGIPRIRTLDGRSSLELRAYKSGSEYRSGHVKSYFRFDAGYGQQYRVRARIKMIAKNGNSYKGFSETYGAWPAFWTVNEDPNTWPKKGEIDIMEGYSYGNRAHFASNLFYGANYLQNELGTDAERSYDVSEGWHTYEQRWTKYSNGWITVRIYLDGRQVSYYDNNINSNLRLQNFKDHHIIFNLNVGSNGGIFNNSRINLFSNTYMYVDWVAVDRRSI